MADNRATAHALPRMSQAFAVQESTFGTQVKPAATDGFRFLSGGPGDAKPERIDVDEHRDSRSREERVTGQTAPVPWSFEANLRPVASPGSGGNGPPDVHLMIKEALGTYAQGASSETYTLSDDQGDFAGLSLYKMIPSPAAGVKDCIVGRAAKGCFVDEMEIKFSGTAAPTIRFAGMATNATYTTRTTANGAPSSATISVADPESVQVGSVVAFYEAADGTTVVPDPGAERTGDNDGAGFIVTANDGTNITVDANIPTNVESGDIVAPWTPIAGTFVGSPVSPYVGSLTVGGVVIVPIEGSILLKNNHAAHEGQAFQQYMTGFHSNWRDVTLSFSARAQSQKLELLSRRESFGIITTTLVIGQSSGGICTVTFKGEAMFEDQDEGSMDDTGIMKFSYKGTASSTGAADELQVVFT